ncbi:GM13131 [Drosophila sechellia]|uniref:GM13131 n=1 Tax=Drosophila sechellia TaxID=7238 RepID=B4IMI9_DROSE|nr:GM13131 [Drosophila sechellia]
MQNTGDCLPAPPTSPDSGEIQRGNSAGTVIPVVESVATIKLPQNVRLWFVQIEAQFQCSRISSDNTRYYHLISALDADIMT